MDEIDNLNKNDLTISEIQAMKVADLKRELKLRGFSTTGNKTELADRLIAALSLPKNADASESCEDVNEDEVLSEDALLQDDVKVQEDISEEEIFGSSGEVKETTKNNVSVSKPKESGGAGEGKQKIQLSRRLKTFPSVAKKESNGEKHTVISSVKDDDAKPAVTTTKSLSQAERLSLRAKRFNLEEPAKGKIERLKTGKGPVLSGKVTPDVTATVSQLKKRAERFGQNVSSVMKQVERKEILLKRKARFGQTVVSSVGREENLKKKRLERFGLRQ